MNNGGDGALWNVHSHVYSFVLVNYLRNLMGAAECASLLFLT